MGQLQKNSEKTSHTHQHPNQRERSAVPSPSEGEGYPTSQKMRAFTENMTRKGDQKKKLQTQTAISEGLIFICPS
jgi:hypothetical protein